MTGTIHVGKNRLRCSCWLAVLLWLRCHDLVTPSSSNHDRKLRLGKKKAEETVYYEGRVSNILKRIYGTENSHVRREVHRIENLSERSRTGIRSNPDHIVPYENHPYDIVDEATGRRRLEEEGHTTSFKPIRIATVTDAMDLERNALNGAQIDFIKRLILPRTVKFWEESLMVVPVSGPLKMDRGELTGRVYCGDSEFTAVPETHFTDGLSNTDLVLYVSARPSSRFCGPSTLAVAVACNFDQHDRPTAGAINFCLDQVELDGAGGASEAVVQDNVDVAVHEAAHVLAMSSNSYRFFHDSDTGRARTSRPFSSSTVKCVDGQQRSLVLPSENTLKFFDASNGQRYAAITTPKVLAVTRNQFDCQEIEGAPLENQPTGAQSCTGDHWEERLFYPEALSGVISPTTNIMSPLTLSLMEDSGWYVANYTHTQISPWGHGAGCDFITKSCVEPTETGEDTVVPSFGREYFCHRANQRGCSTSHTHKMACTVIDYSLYFPPNPPPKQFQYFGNEITLGGPRQADFCPVYGSTYAGRSADGLDCRVPDNRDVINLFGEYYGENSRCFETTTGEGRCYQARCVMDTRTLVVLVRGEWKKCTYDFEEVDIQSASGVFDGKLTCPRLSSVCPGFFCPANCAGRGVCDYRNVDANGTVRPKCKCFNTSDTSEGCSESLIIDGSYLSDSSNLQDLLDSGLFDPLVSVFVDHPDTWTTETWAWAAGLFVIFLMMILCVCASCWPQKTPTQRRVVKRKRKRRVVAAGNNTHGRTSHSRGARSGGYRPRSGVIPPKRPRMR